MSQAYLYELSRINERVLDFDQEKCCSVTLSNVNVYCCLECGKYYQGKTTNSPAFLHSIIQDHHIFMSFTSFDFIFLPEDCLIPPNYQLERIKFAACPGKFIPPFTSSLPDWTVGLEGGGGETFVIGMIPLNFVKQSDYLNVVIQSFLNVPPIYEKLLNYSADNTLSLQSTLAQLVKKIWNRNSLKPFINPHELLQCIYRLSNGKFGFLKQESPHDFMNWLLYQFITEEKDPSPLVLHLKQLFQGFLIKEEGKKNTLKRQPFFHIPLDIPFQLVGHDSTDQSNQFQLENLLVEFMLPFQSIQLPDYLIIYYRRNKLNQWKDLEINHSIVKYPIKGLVFPSEGNCKYQLICNVFQEQNAEKSLFKFKCHLLHKQLDRWYLMNGLQVEQIFPQTIYLSESILQVSFCFIIAYF